jgi:hypothetical protein
MKARGRTANSAKNCSAMRDKYHLDLAQLEEDLWLLEQHTKHVVSLLGRHLVDVGQRISALRESTHLFQEIRDIKGKVHRLQGKTEV